MITLNLTVQNAQAMPQPVLDWLIHRMNPTDADWLIFVRGAGLPAAAPPQPPVAVQTTSASNRIVEQTPEGVRVTIPPATTNGIDQRNSPFWAQGAMANPAALAATSVNVPVVPSAVPPVASPQAPAAPTGLNAAMFNPVAPPAPQQAAPTPSGRTGEHMRNVVFPQIMSKMGIETCKQILSVSGVPHLNQITDANVDQVAAAVQQVTGVPA